MLYKRHHLPVEIFSVSTPGRHTFTQFYGGWKAAILDLTPKCLGAEWQNTATNGVIMPVYETII
jgi:hypothetical protein